VSEDLSYLTHLHAEHGRVSALLASLDGDSPLGKARIVFLGKILAALEGAIRIEEAR